MSRLAVLVFALTALPWSGESFVSTIASSTSTTTEKDYGLPRLHRSGKRRIRPYTLRQPSKPQQDQYPELSSPIVTSVISYKRSSSLLHAALISDPSSSGGEKNRPGWHRRILGKISGRRKSKSSSSLTSSTVEQEEAQDSMVDTFVLYEKDNDFVVQNFDSMTPNNVLPVVEVSQLDPPTLPKVPSPKQIDTKAHSLSDEPPVIDSEYFDVAITPAIPDTVPGDSVTTDIREQQKRGIVCRMLQNVLLERLGERWPIETPQNLKVEVRESPDNYNNVLRLLFRGLFRADATLSSDRIIFPAIRFSGVKLQMEKVTLNLMGFFVDKSKEDIHLDVDVQHGPYPKQLDHHHQRPLNAKPSSKPRYPKQFDVHIEELTMSRDDLLFSPCIKNGLRQLLINVLKDRGIRSDSIEITWIDILPSGKVSIIGEAKTHFPSEIPVHFEVRSGISFSSRGHVLTFPGLEVTLNRDIGLFVPIHRTLDLDVGHNAKFHTIEIDGREKLLRISASVTITPERTRQTHNYVQTSDAFSSMFFYDVGQWLTRLGKFSK